MSSFLFDNDKMQDFYVMSRLKFLEFYSYLNDDDYNDTIKHIMLLIANRM
jgi:hypothetical protein